MFELVLGAGLVIGLVTFFGRKKEEKSILATFEKNWLLDPTADDPRGEEIVGEWEGIQSNSESMNLKIESEIGEVVRARLTVLDGAITGELVDQFGVSEVDGIIDYPRVKLISRLRSVVKTGTQGAREKGIRYYQGELSHHGCTFTGNWFNDPLNRYKASGSFRLSHQERSNLLTMEEKLCSGLNKEEDSEIRQELQEEVRDSDFEDADGCKEEKEESGATIEERSEAIIKANFEATREANIEADLEAIKRSLEVEPSATADSTNVLVSGYETYSPEPPEIVVPKHEPGLEDLAVLKREEDNKLPPVEPELLAGGIKGSIVCPHCSAETSASFDFCLYCSQSLKSEA